jgi:endonuclease/exonuclease/phosphatase family metal-dependent hydrolase
MKRLMMFMVFATMIFCAASCAERTNEIKVISYNIRMSGNPDADGENYWTYRKEASLNMIRDEKPTVFGLQEACADQQEYMTANLTEYGSYGVGRDDGQSKGEHMTIFWLKEEVEMLDCGTFWLSETPDEVSKGWDAQCRRTCTWTILKMKKTGEKFAYFNTHLDHRGKEAKANGMKLLAAKVKELVPEDMTVSMTGDFNTRPDNAIFEPLREVMQDSRVTAPSTDERPTSNGWKKEGGSIIDYVLYRNAQPLTYKVLRDKDYGAPFISDHYPVVMTATF